MPCPTPSCQTARWTPRWCAPEAGACQRHRRAHQQVQARLPPVLALAAGLGGLLGLLDDVHVDAHVAHQVLDVLLLVRPANVAAQARPPVMHRLPQPAVRGWLSVRLAIVGGDRRGPLRRIIHPLQRCHVRGEPRASWLPRLDGRRGLWEGRRRIGREAWEDLCLWEQLLFGEWRVCVFAVHDVCGCHGRRRAHPLPCFDGGIVQLGLVHGCGLVVVMRILLLKRVVLVRLTALVVRHVLCVYLKTSVDSLPDPSMR